MEEEEEEEPLLGGLDGFGGRGLVGEGVLGGPSASSGDGTTGGGPVTALSEPSPLSGLVFTPSVDRLRLSSSVEANATKRSKPELMRSCQSASPSAKISLSCVAVVAQ